MKTRRTLQPGGALWVLLGGLLLLPASVAPGDDADDIARAINRRTPNRAEAAKKILDAVRALNDTPGIQIRLCEIAYEQGMLAPGGYPTAIAALNLLERVAPTRINSWREKRLEVYRLQYYRSTRDTKADNGLIYVKLLLVRARANGKSDNWRNAAKYYRQAYQVARTLKLPEKDAISADLKMAGSYEMIHNRIEVLRTALTRDPDDGFSRKQLVMAFLVDLDKPGEAVKYLSDRTDATLRANVTMAAKEASALADADFFSLATWYRDLGGKAPLKHIKIRMLTRALNNLNLYLEVYTKPDAQRLRASTLVTLVTSELKQLGAEVAPPVARLPEGVILALSFDEGQWTAGKYGARIKDVSGKGKGARAISAQQVEGGKVGRAARVNKTGAIDPGMTLTREPRTFAFWAKADSAQQTNIMLFGTVGYSGRFYIGYDEQRVLGIGMGTSRWRNESNGLKLDTAWHHYAVTWDGKAMALYVDGRLRARKAERISPRGPLYIGAGASSAGRSSRSRGSSRSSYRPAYGLSGLIDEVAVFGRVLSEAEIRKLVACGNAGTPLGK